MSGDKFTFGSAGQVHELELAMRRAGDWNSKLVKRMCGGDHLMHIRNYIKGLAEITMIEHIIDCTSYPLYIPESCTIEEHVLEGRLAWSAKKVSLYLAPGQKNTKGIKGHRLCRVELTDERVLNACVLEYLFERPTLIPDEWKKVSVFFWGTIYLNEKDRPMVRFLYWSDASLCWREDIRFLDDEWFDHQPAVILKS